MGLQGSRQETGEGGEAQSCPTTLEMSELLCRTSFLKTIMGPSHSPTLITCACGFSGSRERAQSNKALTSPTTLGVAPERVPSPDSLVALLDGFGQRGWGAGGSLEVHFVPCLPCKKEKKQVLILCYFMIKCF